MIESRNYKKENTERNYLNIMQNNLFLKVKNSFLELEKDFIDPKDTKLKNREIKIKREIEELLVKPIFVSIEDMNRFEKRDEKNKTS